MTKTELKKTNELLCAVMSVTSQLEQYYNDYRNLTIRLLAEDLRKAVVKFQKK